MSDQIKHVFKENEHLWLYSMGKRFRITAIFTEIEQANDYMATHPDAACIAEFKPFVFLANKYGGEKSKGPQTCSHCGGNGYEP